MNQFFTCLLLFVILGAGLFVDSSFAACCGDDQRKPSICPNISCDWERSDGRCNSNEECCPGKECHETFGYCQPCTNF
jgi:hypothetical protein